MSKTIYPAIRDFTLAVLLAAEPGAHITPATVDAALGRYGDNLPSWFGRDDTTFEAVRDDLDKAHMLDDDARLTPLADRYADMWRRFLTTKKT
jgi:hypothetical protein